MNTVPTERAYHTQTVSQNTLQSVYRLGLSVYHLMRLKIHKQSPWVKSCQPSISCSFIRTCPHSFIGVVFMIPFELQWQMCYSVFHHYSKMLDMINLQRKKKRLLCLIVLRFHFLVSWFILLGPVVR